MFKCHKNRRIESEQGSLIVFYTDGVILYDGLKISSDALKVSITTIIARLEPAGSPNFR